MAVFKTIKSTERHTHTHTLALALKQQFKMPTKLFHFFNFFSKKNNPLLKCLIRSENADECRRERIGGCDLERRMRNERQVLRVLQSMRLWRLALGTRQVWPSAPVQFRYRTGAAPSLLRSKFSGFFSPDLDPFHILLQVQFSSRIFHSSTSFGAISGQFHYSFSAVSVRFNQIN